jgi:hypothetical protein
MASIGGLKARANRIKLRNSVFGKPANDDIFDSKSAKGWRPVPRTFPLILALIHRLAPKGKADGAARVYFELFMRDMGEGFVELTDEDAHAFASGYADSRSGVRSWRDCINVIVNLGFIKIQPNGMRSLGYALLLDPDKVVEGLLKKQSPNIPRGWLNTYQQRKVQTGAA